MEHEAHGEALKIHQLSPELLNAIVEKVTAEFMKESRHTEREEPSEVYRTLATTKTPVSEDVILSPQLPSPRVAYRAPKSLSHRYFEEQSAVDKKWGMLFDKGCDTLRLEHILRGLANHIVSIYHILGMY